MNGKEKQASVWTCLGNEFLQGLFSLIYFAVWYTACRWLLPASEWIMQVWPALVLTVLTRSALIQRKNRSGAVAPETWRGWIVADIVLIGFFFNQQQSFPETGFILFVTPVFGAAFRSSPFLVARLSALMLALFIVARSVMDTPPDAQMWIKQISVLLLFLLAPMFISVQLHRKKTALTKFASDALALFERIHLKLILVDEGRTIINANQRSLDLLNLDARDVQGRSVHKIILDPPEQKAPVGKDSTHWSGLITQEGGVLKRVHVEQVPLNLPASMDRIGRKGNLAEYSLLLMREEHEVDRTANQNAVLKRMLEVFADGVRNPLAGVSAHIQMLARNGAAATEEEQDEQRKRFNTIVAEIAEIDTLMETLMNHARLTPEDVEKRFQALKDKRRNGAS